MRILRQGLEIKLAGWGAQTWTINLGGKALGFIRSPWGVDLWSPESVQNLDLSALPPMAWRLLWLVDDPGPSGFIDRIRERAVALAVPRGSTDEARLELVLPAGRNAGHRDHTWYIKDKAFNNIGRVEPHEPFGVITQELAILAPGPENRTFALVLGSPYEFIGRRKKNKKQ